MGKVSPARKERLRLRAKIERTLWGAMTAQRKAEGACCRGCEHKSRIRMACALGSDFSGHAPVAPDHVCPRWAPRS